MNEATATMNPPPPATNIDLDLETMGAKGNDPAILQIAAIATDAGGNVLNEFSGYVNLESAQAFGSIDSSTILWWMAQSDEARARLIQGVADGQHMTHALVTFSEWYRVVTRDQRDANVWGYGSLSDVLWLRSAFQAANIEVPWDRDGKGYRRERCLRTLHTEIGLPWPEFEGIKHDALSDARNQSRHRVDLQGWIKDAHAALSMQGCYLPPDQLG